MAVDHVEVALVYRHVDQLQDGTPGRVNRRRQIGELHEIAEILDRRVTPRAVEVTHEGRAVDRRENGRLAADMDIAVRIARMPGEFLRRGLQKLAAEPLGEMHPL